MSPQEQYLAQNSLAILRDKNVRAGEDSHYEIDCVTPTKQRLVNLCLNGLHRHQASGECIGFHFPSVWLVEKMD
ncbi:hypothetical protein HmCmsJML078_00346 [Escherichia coli]|nr:hypothetical protein HmCmsJML078_00346 [Escherichia coli]